ncbi:uncharacterized protein HD556DRAFT_674219 [Suillus plorans]|uniref:Mitochondrial carrier n=1 Tax=Suillus plorans TaxID=116603 RepID=A0A9P7ALR6_9AGAM|nr:uncharacterized protein HD556DRAFT_674219 [Suillus plorans]KAG1790964.1 hypothetical protein HD556DRAFT_674219 [Suillus plorans]
MSTNLQDNASKEQQGNSLYAALARTATRGVALYFSRPVRLFRPAKVSGWHSLRGHANKHGASLSVQYISTLVKKQGFMVIPKHFVPPMVANAMLGTVLWTTYTESSNYLEARLGTHPTLIAALSGAAAGGTQALIAAPVENTRLIIEGGTGRGWSHAWQEVFRGTEPPRSASRVDNIKEIRQVRHWMKEVSEMAGRGWDGWGWGCAKDVCGFAAFFMIFEITRRVALASKAAAQGTIQNLSTTPEEHFFGRHFPRAIHGITLVAGGASAGLAYEILSRPWDVTRRTIQSERTVDPTLKHSLFVIVQKIRGDGIIHFFRDPSTAGSEKPEMPTARRRIYSGVRTLARVGPWGLGFLVWEAFGPGLS